MKQLAMSLLALCLSVSVVIAAAPPSNPPSPAPATSLPDLRGTWTGSSREANDDGFPTTTLTVKITEKSSNGLYRGWVTSVFTGGSQTTSFSARLGSDNILNLSDGYTLGGLKLDYHPTTNTAVFPTGWQPVLIGSVHRIDDGTASPDSSRIGFCFLKKTTP
jgi:hypothetical protein